MPGRLRAVVCRGMEQMQAVLVEAQRAEAVAPSRKLNVLGTPHCHTLTLHSTAPDHIATLDSVVPVQNVMMEALVGPSEAVKAFSWNGRPSTGTV